MQGWFPAQRIRTGYTKGRVIMGKMLDVQELNVHYGSIHAIRGLQQIQCTKVTLRS